MKQAVSHHCETRRPSCAEEGIQYAGGALLQCNVAAAVRRCAQRSARCNKPVYAWGLSALQAGAHPGWKGPHFRG